MTHESEATEANIAPGFQTPNTVMLIENQKRTIFHFSVFEVTEKDRRGTPTQLSTVARLALGDREDRDVRDEGTLYSVEQWDKLPQEIRQYPPPVAVLSREQWLALGKRNRDEIRALEARDSVRILHVERTPDGRRYRSQLPPEEAMA